MLESVVAASVVIVTSVPNVIAPVRATGPAVALAFVDKFPFNVMAFAVTAMHYAGMSALRLRPQDGTAAVTGTDALNFIPAILISVVLVAVGLLYAVLVDPAAEERHWREHVRRFTEPVG